MAIRYKLFRNGFLKKPNHYVAMVQPVRTVDLEDLIERICRRGSTVGEADVRAVLTDFFFSIEQSLLEGCNVTTPAANFSSSIRGIFEGYNDRFSSARHRILPQVSAGKTLRKAFKRRAKAAKWETPEPEPSPHYYRDVNSGRLNDTLTPRGIGQLTGRYLKYDPDDPQQGVFFLPIEPDGRARRTKAIRVDVVVMNKPRQLIFQVPPLDPGPYRLEVRAILRDREHLREGLLQKVLAVAPLEAPSLPDPTAPADEVPTAETPVEPSRALVLVEPLRIEGKDSA